MTRVTCSQIDAIPYLGNVTNIAGGLQVARVDVLGRTTNRPLYKDVIVLLSDGGDNVNAEEVGEGGDWGGARRVGWGIGTGGIWSGWGR